MTVQFHPLAERELNDAARFYEGQATGLGAKFLNEIHRLLTLLAAYPGLGRPTARPLRTVRARRFPYSLVYQVIGDRLVVLAVAPHRRQPRYWAGRAPTP
jgi:plasmid stabilization system protein ParE